MNIEDIAIIRETLAEDDLEELTALDLEKQNFKEEQVEGGSVGLKGEGRHVCEEVHVGVAEQAGECTQVGRERHVCEKPGTGEKQIVELGSVCAEQCI